MSPGLLSTGREIGSGQTLSHTPTGAADLVSGGTSVIRSSGAGFEGEPSTKGEPGSGAVGCGGEREQCTGMGAKRRRALEKERDGRGGGRGWPGRQQERGKDVDHRMRREESGVPGWELA